MTDVQKLRLLWKVSGETAQTLDEGQQPRFLRMWQAYLFLDALYAILMCRVVGHDLTCESCITPDSGSEWICCKRCGWSKDITYY